MRQRSLPRGRAAKCVRARIRPPVLVAGLALALPAAAPAWADLVIDPTFDTSITGNTNSTQIEGAIDSAIGTIDGLYTGPTAATVTVPVTFSYNPAGAGNLLSTSQLVYGISYTNYVNLLKADAAANPANTVLATAIVNLPHGNDSDGSKDLAVAGNQLQMLGLSGTPANATININSIQPFMFTRPVNPSQFDAIGGLEHELDEVLGGGGAGSTLNEIASLCPGDPSNFFCNKVGPTDLYRYSADLVPSFTTDPTATPYLSVDGGATPIVSLNQDSNGDFGDFAPPGTGPGQLIQNAFNSTGQDEDYTTGSPEYPMELSIGWDPKSVIPPVPEPATLALLATSLLGLGALRRRRR